MDAILYCCEGPCNTVKLSALELLSANARIRGFAIDKAAISSNLYKSDKRMLLLYPQQENQKDSLGNEFAEQVSLVMLTQKKKTKKKKNKGKRNKKRSNCTETKVSHKFIPEDEKVTPDVKQAISNQMINKLENTREVKEIENAPTVEKVETTTSCLKIDIRKKSSIASSL